MNKLLASPYTHKMEAPVFRYKRVIMRFFAFEIHEMQEICLHGIMPVAKLKNNNGTIFSICDVYGFRIYSMIGRKLGIQVCS